MTRRTRPIPSPHRQVGVPAPTDRLWSRRSLLTTFVAVPSLALVAAACGDDSVEPSTSGAGAPGTDPTDPDPTAPGSGSSATGISHPTGADDVVLRLGYQGGFVPAGTAFVDLPTVLVSGDGRVFTPAPTTLQFPGPLVASLNVRTISEAGIQRLLSLAKEQGLLAPPPDYTIESMVADAPDTVLRLSAEGGTFEHRAYALDFDDAGPGNEAARATLRAYTALLTDLPTTVGADELGEETVFEPTVYRIQALPSSESGVSEIEPPPTFVDWPATTGVRLADATECATIDAAVVGELFSAATQLTFFREDGQVYAVAVAAVLPGDPVS